MPTSIESVLLPGFTVEQVMSAPEGLTIVAAPSNRARACPSCGSLSTRGHSSTVRTPRDLPLNDHGVRFPVRVRRFRCLNPLCPRRSFAERLPLLPVHAQPPTRLTLALRALGFALGGAAGARVGRQVRLPTSPDSLVRLIKQTSIDVHTPRVVGIDDVALRRGQRYGTVLVDREQRRPIDVLPDRDAQTLEPWLQAHRGVEMVTRDRSPAYARGATVNNESCWVYPHSWCSDRCTVWYNQMYGYTLSSSR